MPLRRISDQKSQTIEEFFQQLVEEQKDIPWKTSGKVMLELIERLNNLFKEEVIWCLTSLYRLVLLAEDSWQSPWYIIISCYESGEFIIEYLIPDSEKPWDGARVCGGATSINQLEKYILIAMQNSGGWQNNSVVQEFQKLLKK
jgi:hypothetical protein